MVDLRVCAMAVTMHEAVYAICNDNDSKYSVRISLNRNKNKAVIRVSDNIGWGDSTKTARFKWLDIAELFMTEPCIKNLCEYTHIDVQELSVLETRVNKSELTWSISKMATPDDYSRWSFSSNGVVLPYAYIPFNYLKIHSSTKIKMSFVEFMQLLKRTHVYIQETKYSGNVDK